MLRFLPGVLATFVTLPAFADDMDIAVQLRLAQEAEALGWDVSVEGEPAKAFALYAAHYETSLSRTEIRAHMEAATRELVEPASREETAVVEDKLREELIDPGSLSTRNLTAIPIKDGLRLVCGEYNAKNRFGGYVGYKPFLAVVKVDTSEVAANLSDRALAGCRYGAMLLW